MDESRNSVEDDDKEYQREKELTYTQELEEDLDIILESAKEDPSQGGLSQLGSTSFVKQKEDSVGDSNVRENSQSQPLSVTP